MFGFGFGSDLSAVSTDIRSSADDQASPFLLAANTAWSCMLNSFVTAARVAPTFTHCLASSSRLAFDLSTEHVSVIYVLDKCYAVDSARYVIEVAGRFLRAGGQTIEDRCVNRRRLVCKPSKTAGV